MRYGFIRDHRREFRVWKMCEVLSVSKSGYYAWLNRPESNRAREERILLSLIRMVYARHQKRYGSPRIADTLCDEGYRVKKSRIARIMRDNGIRARGKRKFRVTTNARHHLPVAENLLDRQFNVTTPNRVWVADLTYIRTGEGWLYLAAVMDLYSRRIVGWAMRTRITSELTLEALHQALGRRTVHPGLLHHSDRGSQYAAGTYQQLLERHGITVSMSRKGDCWDNAPMESFFATLKTELVHQETFLTREEARGKIFAYIEAYYNRKRRHSTLGYKSPVDFENAAKLS